MNFQDWFKLFQEQILHTSLIEWLAVGFGVSEVLLAKKNSIWLYPTGIISILLSMFLLLNVKLYAETLLSIYYLVMSVYGWIIWKKRKQDGENQVSWSSNKELTIAVLISVIGFGVLYLVLRHYTDSDVPVFDAFVSSTAWAGMWLLAKRKIENWIFLNISNIVAIPLLFHKKLPLMACLTTFLFTVAIFGFLDWKKIINKSRLKLA
ncbi:MULTISPECIES: nicotinamide riboside transporter PnuC [Pedobacter]|jgi:nicotinamide mononucleotide transporter|uniref:nicotinamide riboside transporter PnuC n=1 Tax=Pedobacter TaxID=84567 RepID=UPI0004930B0C|nr:MULTISPECIES: nicotinamide riboside transporter PnuC [Pedobacter]MBT2563679.1 nicotinamide mononucleotide transporter [Pedobacter sp. ISL-64]MBT2589571.1 nicotinamide mononucleotide transporter [Pedobacter sp. ISL-68]MDQ0969848.1 nicotinamide mononucleotide transporter [Flavobacterium sp. W4I14]